MFDFDHFFVGLFLLLWGMWDHVCLCRTVSVLLPCPRLTFMRTFYLLAADEMIKVVGHSAVISEGAHVSVCVLHVFVSWY